MEMKKTMNEKYKDLPEYKALEAAMAEVKRTREIHREADGKCDEAKDELAKAICKFKVGQKVSYRGQAAIITHQVCAVRWSDEISPSYVLRKVKKDGSVSTVSVYHGFEIGESELTLL